MLLFNPEIMQDKFQILYYFSHSPKIPLILS